MLLLDAGVERKSLYTADVTRTLPVSGTYSPEQRAVYDIVWQAQRAGIAAVVPGNDFLEPNRRAMRVLAEGLIDLGILNVSLDEALDPGNEFFRRYTLHNVSHMLGIDVHDCARARAEAYRYGTLRAGMVLTVEPGHLPPARRRDRARAISRHRRAHRRRRRGHRGRRRKPIGGAALAGGRRRALDRRRAGRGDARDAAP